VKQADFTIILEISSITPNSGSSAGGSLVTIIGFGFSELDGTNQVYIGTDGENDKTRCTLIS
jgi:hypothetical protein